MKPNTSPSKLTLNRETVKAMRVRSAVRTGMNPGTVDPNVSAIGDCPTPTGHGDSVGCASGKCIVPKATL